MHRGAIRRGNFLYIFGNNKYFKYYYTNSRPTLQLGYPKDITENFEGVSKLSSNFIESIVLYSIYCMYNLDREQV